MPGLSVAGTNAADPHVAHQGREWWRTWGGAGQGTTPDAHTTPQIPPLYCLAKTVRSGSTRLSHTCVSKVCLVVVHQLLEHTHVLQDVDGWRAHSIATVLVCTAGKRAGNRQQGTSGKSAFEMGLRGSTIHECWGHRQAGHCQIQRGGVAVV